MGRSMYKIGSVIRFNMDDYAIVQGETVTTRNGEWVPARVFKVDRAHSPMLDGPISWIKVDSIISVEESLNS